MALSSPSIGGTISPTSPIIISQPTFPGPVGCLACCSGTPLPSDPLIQVAHVGF